MASQVLGIKNLQKNLKQLAKDVKEKDLNYATRKAANPIRDKARENAPVESGRLREDIVTRKTTKYSEYDSEYTVGIRNRKRGRKGDPNRIPPAVYGPFVEFGTSKQPAQPFIRPAYDSEGPKTLQRFNDVLSKRIRLRVKQGKIKV
ncbi:HK97-gp10 family putative phage morphogenesis protein [Salinisphaera sp. LB1]|uniref:HK97-gp10 family putative phage morphogenesis protein n=1 Tax=Salinisphaera sp. LB1 TaxID=2183911 RepID=UPI000D707130|nr:HK97-gp10 family putative phage morphogenesis protein [Salinisphaera sp. LB1]